MKVKLTTARVGSLGGNVQDCGDAIDVPEAEARALIAAGEAEPMADEPKPKPKPKR